MAISKSRRVVAGLLAATISAAVAVAAQPQITAPTSTATVGVPYSSSCGFTFGGATTYTLASGSLPGGLQLDNGTCAITGTPGVAGTFNFTIQVTYSLLTSTAMADQAQRGVKQSAPAGATVVSPPFTITVAPGAATGAPALGEWAMFGLAGGMALLGGILLKKKQSNLL